MSTIYVVVLTYIKPLEEVDRAIPAHIEWLKKGYADGLFLASGRRIPRTGGVILAKCDSRETLQARLSQDPFQLLGLARTEIIPFEASMASPGAAVAVITLSESISRRKNAAVLSLDQ